MSVSKREEKAKELQELSKYISKMINIETASIEENAVLERVFTGSKVLEKLVIKEERWAHPSFGSFPLKNVLYCKELPTCSYCGRRIEENELILLLEPSLKIACIKCTKPVGVFGTLLPRDEIWLTVTPAFVKIRR